MTHPPTALPLKVRLFASLRERAGCEELALEAPAGATVADLKGLVRAACPAIAPYLEASRVAVNLSFAPDGQALKAGDELALIPPVSGG